MLVRLAVPGGWHGRVQELEQHRRERYIDELRAAAILEFGEEIVEFVQPAWRKPRGYGEYGGGEHVGDSGEEEVTAEQLCMVMQQARDYSALLTKENPVEDEDVAVEDEEDKLIAEVDRMTLWPCIQYLRADLVADEEAEEVKARRTQHRNFSLFMSPVQRFGSVLLPGVQSQRLLRFA